MPDGRRPLILTVDDQEWSARSLESVLRSAEVDVVRAYTGAQALDLVARIEPDLIFVEYGLPHQLGTELCRSLREIPGMGFGLPIILTTGSPIPRSTRLTVLEAGAWDILQLPVDAEELLLRVRNYLNAKIELDDVRRRSLVDLRTGLYNSEGLERRFGELFSDASRSSTSLGCILVGVGANGKSVDVSHGDDEIDPIAKGLAAEEAAVNVGSVLVDVCRTSDVVARTGRSNFVVLAGRVDSDQARRLAARIAEAVRERVPSSTLWHAGEEEADRSFGIGATAVSPDRDEAPVALEELLQAARAARHQT